MQRTAFARRQLALALSLAAMLLVLSGAARGATLAQGSPSAATPCASSVASTGDAATPAAEPCFVAPGSGSKLVRGETFTGVIFAPEVAAELAFGQTGQDRYEEYWQPTRADVLGLEAALPAFLAQEAPDLAERLATDEYRRQYGGVVLDGRPLILVNAFCSWEGADWETEPFFVLDGGDCFFQVTYDVAAGTFSDLQINGEA